MSLTAEIITIGDEILYGQTLDTNSHWISSELDAINVKVYQKTTIGDEEVHILESLKVAEQRADIILITGGLGPTNDDLTKPTMAKYFQVGLVLNEEALEEINNLFAQAGRPMSIMNEKQAELPENCKKIRNHVGTAPGMWFEERGKVFVCMPGVPHEMKSMMTRNILPEIKERFVNDVLIHKIIKTVMIPESRLAQLIEDWESSLPTHLKLAYLPTLGQVKMRITGSGADTSQLQKEIDDQVKLVLPFISEHVYGFDEDELEAVVGKLLSAKNATIATAESCTGGQVASHITSIPGSSAYFKGAIIAYDNQVKTDLLGVPNEILEAHGAVSEAVVRVMAENVRKVLKTDVGLATSGVAGPTGGSEDKPVGTIWVAYSDQHKTVAQKMMFTKDRKFNIHISTLAALNMFRLNF